MDTFHQEYAIDGKQAYKLYTADLWAVSLGREVRVVIVDYIDTDKKRQTRKVFFSTDLSLSAQDIFDIYRTRFQIEFVYYDKHIIMQNRSKTKSDNQLVINSTSHFNFA